MFAPAKLCLLLFLALPLLWAGCTTPSALLMTPPAAGALPDHSGQSEEELTVAAAADLQFAFTEIADEYRQRTGQSVALVFGSTGQLKQQIENGAPYDLFAAANIDYIDQLVDTGYVLPDTVAVYARGRIVLAANKKAGIAVTTLADFAAPEIRHVAIANPEHAPYGLAAQQALQAAGIWDIVKPRLVLGENVRQTLQYIQSGDAEAGIVALSVTNVPEVTWTLIDESLHQPLDQALGVVAGSQHRQPALDFIALVNSDTGREIMRKYGFLLPGETPAFPATQP